MSNQNIDSLLDSMDSFLDDGEDLTFNPQEVMKTFYQKKSAKLKKNIIVVFVALISFGLAMYLEEEMLSVKINYAIIMASFLIIYWLNHKSRLALSSQDKAVSFLDYKNKKEAIILVILKQYNLIKYLVFVIFGIEIGFVSYWSYEYQSLYLFIVGTLTMLISCWLAHGSIKNYINDLKEELKK